MQSGEEQTSFHVRRAIGGSTASVTWIIERFTPALLVSANYRLGQHLRRHCDAEDVVNELWITVVGRLGGIEPREGRFTPVLLRFLATAMISRINNLARKFARGELTRADTASGGLPDVRSPMTDVVSRVARNEESARLREAIDGLPENDREILVLRGIEQSDNQEVALRLSITPDAAAVRYHRALKRLRSKLAGSIFDDLGTA